MSPWGGISLKKGIPYGQFLHLKRNCSSISGFKKQAQDLQIHFREKRLPDYILRQAYKKSLTTDRTELLTPRDKDTSSCQLIHLIGTFDEASSSVKAILTKHWDILRLDPDPENA